MSAWMVSQSHIDALLHFGLRDPRYGALRWYLAPDPDARTHQRGEPWGPEAIEEANRRRRELTPETAGLVGAMLLAENARSVGHRYDEDELEHERPYLYTPPAPRFQIDALTCLKAIACYEYQSCEHAEWETSEARAFCDALRIKAIHALEGYEEADGWGLDFPRGPQIRARSTR